MMIISNDIFTLGHIYKQGQKVLIYILYLVTLVGNNFLQYFCKSSAVLHNCHRTSCACLPVFGKYQNHRLSWVNHRPDHESDPIFLFSATHLKNCELSGFSSKKLISTQSRWTCMQEVETYLYLYLYLCVKISY